VIDCCFTPSQQFLNYIKTRTSFVLIEVDDCFVQDQQNELGFYIASSLKLTVHRQTCLPNRKDFVSAASHDLDFQCHMSLSFLYSLVWGERLLILV